MKEQYAVLIGVYPKLFDGVKYEVESMYSEVDSENIISAKERAIDRARELSKNFHVKVTHFSNDDLKFYSTTLNSSYLENAEVVFDSDKDMDKINDNFKKTIPLFEEPTLEYANKELLNSLNEDSIQIDRFNKIFYLAKQKEEKNKGYSIIEKSKDGNSFVPSANYFLNTFSKDISYSILDENEKEINIDNMKFTIFFNNKDSQEFYLNLHIDDDYPYNFVVNNLDQSKYWNYIDAKSFIDTHNSENENKINLSTLIEDKNELQKAIIQRKENTKSETETPKKSQKNR